MSRTKKYIKPRNIKRVKSKKYKHRKKKNYIKKRVKRVEHHNNFVAHALRKDVPRHHAHGFLIR